MPSSWMSAGLRRRLRAGARVVGYTAAASLVLAWCGVERVSAELERSSLALGARLADTLGELAAEPQPIVVNGQQLWIASRATALSVPEALDRVDAHCLAGAGSPGAGSPSASRDPLAGARRALIRRDERPGRGGQLVCLAPHQPFTGLFELGERLRALFATGELGALGELRYARARPRPEGGSHVVSVWSAGAFDLLDLLPRGADVPGSDPERAPRPPAATRLLSAAIPGRAYAIRAYASALSADDLLAFYAREMPRQGWAALDPQRWAPGVALPSARAFTQADALTLVVVDDGAERDGAAASRATATIVQVGAPGVARASDGALGG